MIPTLTQAAVAWSLVVIASCAVWRLIDRRNETENRMAKTDATNRQDLKWNGTVGGMKLRVVEMQVQGIGRQATMTCWEVWNAAGIALATGRVPEQPKDDGTADVDATIKLGARLAKAVARVLTLKEVAS